METLTTNKNFIKASIALVVLLSLFVFVRFVNEIKASRYIGRASTAQNTISVSGTGNVTAVSDIATITVNLTKNGATTKEAQDGVNTLVSKTLDYLKTQHIADVDIKSEYGGLNPTYSSNPTIQCFAYPCPQPAQKITGYTATQSITIKVRAVDSANDVRTGLAALGITDISGPTFSIDNQDALNDQARALAIKDARSKAETLASELGVTLSGVTNFSENGGGYPVMYGAKAMIAGSMAQVVAPAPELPKGENKITSIVTITYEIK